MPTSLRVAYTLLQCWHRVPGGTAVSILSLAEAIEGRGDVDLIGVGPWGSSLPAAPWTPPIPVERLPLPYQLVYDAWHRFNWPRVQLATGPVDLVHATTTTVPPAGGAPLVVTVHDLFPLLAPHQFTKRGVRLMTEGIERARRADLVLCPSEATADDCLANGFDPERLRVVPWGVNPRQATVAERSFVRERYRLERPYVLWVGTVEPRKNLPTLLDAFRGLGPRDLDLVLVGPRGWNAGLASHLDGIGDRVRRLGFVPASDLPGLYAEASAFCFPSVREGFGLPALEAMVQETPVIVSANTAVSEVVGTGGLTAEALATRQWIDALESLLDDDAFAAQVGGEGRARAGGYTWDRAAGLTVEAYQDVTR